MHGYREATEEGKRGGLDWGQSKEQWQDRKIKEVNAMRAGRWDGVHPAPAGSGMSVKYGIQSSLQLQVEPPGYPTRRDMVSIHLLIVLLEYSLFLFISFILLDPTHL